MLKTETKEFSKRVIAFWLTITIAMGVLPIGLLSVFAQPGVERTGVFTISVMDEDSGEAIENAVIEGSYGAITIAGNTDEFGVLEIQGITDEIIGNSNATDEELILSVTIAGYNDIINKSFDDWGATLGDEFEDVVVEMEKDNSASITTEPPASVALLVDEALSLSIVATNANGYQWYKDGSAISGATSSIYNKTVGLNDAGTYKCVVTGIDGNDVSSDDAIITVDRRTTTVGISASPNPQYRPNSVELSATGLPSDATGTITFYEGTDVIDSVSVGQTVHFNATGAVNDYTFKIEYSGDDIKYYPSVSMDLLFSFEKGTQTTPLAVNGVPAEKTYEDEPFTVVATGGDGSGVITWEIVDEFDLDGVPTTDVASIDSNGVVTILKAGLFKISALKQGDNDYNAMASPTISSEVRINLKNQTGFAFAEPSPEERTYSPVFTFSNIASGGNGSGAITYEIIAGGSGIAEIDEDTGVISDVTKAGTINVKATKAQDSVGWNEAAANYILTINKAAQTGFAFDDSAPEAQEYSPTFGFTNVASGGQSEHEPSYAITGGTAQALIDNTSSEITTVTKAGTITVTATKLGNDVYNDVTAEYTVAINRADQTTLAFTSIVPTDFRYGMQFTNTATGGESSGEITYQVTTRNDVADVDVNGTITMAKNPPNADTDNQITVTVTATKAEDLVYNEKIITYDLIIHRDNISVVDFKVNGEAIKSATRWYNAADVAAHENKITVTPDNGYTQISTDGLVWSRYLEFTEEEVIGTSFYLKKENGATTNISDVQPINFDKTAPETASITIEDNNPWTNFENNITFGLFSRESKQITITATDDLSGVASIAYYEDNTGNNYTIEQAATLPYITYRGDNKPSVSFEELQTKKVVIYARIMDVAGNVSYFRTNGIIFDNMNPEGSTTIPEPIIQITLPDGKNVELYNNDVPFRVQVLDPDTNGLAAGIESITTTISAPNREDKVIMAKAVSSQLEPLDSSFDSENIISAFSNTGTYVVEKEYNSNYTSITVVAADKAGNEYTRTVSLAIDITNPEIRVSYNNNVFANDRYLGNNLNRNATIEIIERNFDNNAVVIDLTRNGTALNIVPAFTAIPGSVDENGDQIGWRMSIDYAQFSDGDYTFGISYMDRAQNRNSEIDYGSSVNPQDFIIDNIAPTIAVSYDNHSVLNTNYYNLDRNATVTINEHNFDANMVNIIGTAVDDGTTITFPVLNGWTANGDLRTTRISYGSDAYYTFSMEYTDLAGNVAAVYTPDNFYVDKTEPILTNEEVNGTADVFVGDEEATVLEFYDKNFQNIEHSYSAYNFNIKDREQQLYELIAIDNDPSIINGSIVNLADNHFNQDGVYEIRTTAYDLAGNDSGEKVYTYVVMRGTVMMAYIPEENLVKFNNIGTQAIEFEDIPINVYVTNDTAFTLRIGDELLLESTDYILANEPREIANNVKEYKIIVPQRYITNTFDEDNQVYDMPINVINEDGQIIKVGQMVIDNVKPFGEFEEGFESGKGYYGVSEQEVNIIRLSDDIDESNTEVNVNGTNVDFTYNLDAKTITFTLNESESFGHPWAGHIIKVKLVDTAGNEYFMTEISNVYVGNWFFRYWTFFTAGGILLVGASVFIGLEIRKRRSHKRR